MKIKEMFQKDIERDIRGVIKVGQLDEETIYNELDEYVVTNELFRHFNEFFSNYCNSILKSTDNMGVWISGFFGSGKSHFLKILSYILDSNLQVKGRRPIDFFEKDDKIQDQILVNNMKKATDISSDVILFNIDSKAAGKNNKNKEPILDVFLRQFNAMRGYCEHDPYLAELEKQLEDVGLYEEFKKEFKHLDEEANKGKDVKIKSFEWEYRRNAFKFIKKTIKKTLVNIGFMDKVDADSWVLDKKNFYVSIDEFAKEVQEYCSSKGKDHKVIFLVDEIGQYISNDTKLMLNLQTIVEELGIKCNGNAWVVVTSQQDLDDIISKVDQKNDFSKIQGRFDTRLSLSSSNVDEVIRRRLLMKNKVAQQRLEASYPEFEYKIRNIIDFEETAEMKKFKNAKDFANIYPFVPYQFHRIQDVLTAVRVHSSTGKHMADGERSMLALFQKAGISVKENDEGRLVPFDTFYEAIDKFVDHSHKIVIDRAENNENLLSLDVRILKILFMVKYVKEFKATPHNITTLLISNIDDDRNQIMNKVKNSLNRLTEETLIQKNGNIYSFLTDEEQDVNRMIKSQNIEVGEIVDYTYTKVFNDILKYPSKKFQYSKDHNFSFNQSIDKRDKGFSKNDIGIRVITPYYEYGETSNKLNILKGLSDDNNEIVIEFPENLDVFDEIKEILQIGSYLTKNSGYGDESINSKKQKEREDKVTRVIGFLENSILNSRIFIKGDEIEINGESPKTKLDNAFKILIEKVYNKLYYMDFEPSKHDVFDAIGSESQKTFEFVEHKSRNALEDMRDYISKKSEKHISLSLNDLSAWFSKAPYGFSELDIQWLVASLFSNKDISLMINDSEITIRNDKQQGIYDYITKKTYSEKILISEKETVSDIDIELSKTIYKKLFGKSYDGKDSEELMDKFKRESENLLKDIRSYLFEFKQGYEYPGKNILEDCEELLVEINAKKNTSNFYKFIKDNEQHFKDIFSLLDRVLFFFRGTQKEIFEESCDVCKKFEDNKHLIDDEELEGIISDINDIFNDEKIFSIIKDLSLLNDKFNKKLEIILDEKRQIILNDIKHDYEDVVKLLEGDDELILEFKSSFKLEFCKLQEKLLSQTNISIIKGISEESANIKTNCIKKINQFIKDRGTNVNPISESDVEIVSIFSKSKIKIENEEDINEFLEKVKIRLKSELKSNDIVNLKL